VTLDDIKNNILNNKKFTTQVFETYNKLSLKFLRDLSIELRNNKKVKNYPNLIYLMFWCNDRIKLKKNKNKFLNLGRGLVFHVCPANVPTNFVYSFLFGLLSGNSNIIKIPSKHFEEKKLILSIIQKILNKAVYKVFKNSNRFIEYSDNNEITKYLSSICDARVIWGGNKTINDIRKNWIPEKSIELTFADRYSLSLINIDKLKKEKKINFNSIIKKFYYDSYTMNQMACNSPHFVFWLGKKDLNFQKKFWQKLNEIVEKKFSLDEVHAVEKYTNLMENIITNGEFSDINQLKNNVFICTPKHKLTKIENIRGVNGTFFQVNINNLRDLKKFITKKCQTVSYYGLTKKELRDFLLKSNLFGIDRVVPVGRALEIDLIWDGYDVISSLSRIVDYK
jgi:hypothetical protein